MTLQDKEKPVGGPLPAGTAGQRLKGTEGPARPPGHRQGTWAEAGGASGRQQCDRSLSQRRNRWQEGGRWGGWRPLWVHWLSLGRRPALGLTDSPTLGPAPGCCSRDQGLGLGDQGSPGSQAPALHFTREQRAALRGSVLVTRCVCACSLTQRAGVEGASSRGGVWAHQVPRTFCGGLI